jgi:hypothetical protein
MLWPMRVLQLSFTPRGAYCRAEPFGSLSVLRISIPFVALSVICAGLAAPALAQSEGERINQVIVFGNDPCPPAANPDEITVCARKDEEERFRIPAPLRESQSPQNRAWNDRVLAYETIGRTGTLSCSSTGPGGSTGCLERLIDTAYAEKRQSDPSLKFGELIAAERAKRLATLDADAAATQARVEQAEKDYEARQRAQQDADVGGSLPVPGN